MKHKTFRWIPAVLLAAMLLAGCGAETAPPASAARPPLSPPLLPPRKTARRKKRPGADGRRTEQTVAEPPALPENWEQQVLTEWMAVTAVTQGETLCPRRPQRKLYPAAGKGRDHRHGDRLLHPGNIRQPADSVCCRDPYRRAECRRCDRLGRGKKSGLEPDMPQRGRQKPLDDLHDGGRFFADAVHRPEKDGTVWYVFRRTTAWDDIGFAAIPRKLWGTYAPETRPQRASAG